MTTLELARKIADAVLKSAAENTLYAPVDNADDPATQAVLRVLREESSWFCRLSEDPKAGTGRTPYEAVTK